MDKQKKGLFTGRGLQREITQSRCFTLQPGVSARAQSTSGYWNYSMQSMGRGFVDKATGLNADQFKFRPKGLSLFAARVNAHPDSLGVLLSPVCISTFLEKQNIFDWGIGVKGSTLRSAHASQCPQVLKYIIQTGPHINNTTNTHSHSRVSKHAVRPGRDEVPGSWERNSLIYII